MTPVDPTKPIPAAATPTATTPTATPAGGSTPAPAEPVPVGQTQDTITPVKPGEIANASEMFPALDTTPNARIPGPNAGKTADGENQGNGSVFAGSNKNNADPSVFVNSEGHRIQFRYPDGSIVRHPENLSQDQLDRGYARNHPNHSSGPNLLERMLYSIPIIGPLFQSLFGDDEDEQYDDYDRYQTDGPLAPGRRQDTIAPPDSQGPRAGETDAAAQYLKDIGKGDLLNQSPQAALDAAKTAADNCLQSHHINPEQIQGDSQNSATAMKIKLADAIQYLEGQHQTVDSTAPAATIIQQAEAYKTAHPATPAAPPAAPAAPRAASAPAAPPAAAPAAPPAAAPAPAAPPTPQQQDAANQQQIRTLCNQIGDAVKANDKPKEKALLTQVIAAEQNEINLLSNTHINDGYLHYLQGAIQKHKNQLNPPAPPAAPQVDSRTESFQSRSPY